MSAPVDVLSPSSVMAFSEALNGRKGALDAWLEANNEAEVRAHVLAYANDARAAVAELVAADREYDDTQAAYQQARNNTAYAHLKARRVNAFHRAADRRAAALSKFQEGA